MWKKSIRGEGSALKIHISKCGLFWGEGGGPDFQVFPKFKWLKYGPDFDAIHLVIQNSQIEIGKVSGQESEW